MTTFNAKLTLFGDHVWVFIPLFGRLTLFGDHFWAFITLFGTCMQNWDFFGTKFRLWSHLGPSSKFGTSIERLLLRFHNISFKLLGGVDIVRILF